MILFISFINHKKISQNNEYNSKWRNEGLVVTKFLRYIVRGSIHPGLVSKVNVYIFIKSHGITRGKFKNLK